MYHLACWNPSQHCLLKLFPTSDYCDPDSSDLWSPLSTSSEFLSLYSISRLVWTLVLKMEVFEIYYFNWRSLSVYHTSTSLSARWKTRRWCWPQKFLPEWLCTRNPRLPVLEVFSPILTTRFSRHSSASAAFISFNWILWIKQVLSRFGKCLQEKSHIHCKSWRLEVLLYVSV